MSAPDVPTAADRQVLILCAEDGTNRGHDNRARCHAGDGLLHRAVFVVLADPEGRLLLQRRHNTLWDGAWDFAGATHPLSVDGVDESDVDAAARCIRTEWGLDVALTERFAFTYFERDGDHCEREYCIVLTGTTDETPVPNPEHVYAFEWETWTRIKQRMDDEPELFTPWAHAARRKLDAHPEWFAPVSPAE